MLILTRFSDKSQFGPLFKLRTAVGALGDLVAHFGVAFGTEHHFRFGIHNQSALWTLGGVFRDCGGARRTLTLEFLSGVLE